MSTTGIFEQAQQLADLRFNPQQDAINRRIQQIGQQTGLRNQFADVAGQKSRQYVGEAYDTLDQGLVANKAQAMQGINTAADQIGAGFRDAAALNEAARNQSRQYMEQQGAGSLFGQQAQFQQGTLENLANQLAADNRNRDATTTGNLRNWGAQAGSIYDMQLGTGKQMRASSMADIERGILKMISENNLSGAEQETDMGDALLELLGQRGAYFGEQVGELSQREWMKQLEQAKLQQQADQANAELALRAAAQADEQAYRSAASSRDEGRWQAELALKQLGMNKDDIRWQAEFDRAGQQYGSDRDFEMMKLMAAGQEAGLDPGYLLDVAKFVEGEGFDEEGAARRIQMLQGLGAMPGGGWGQSLPPPPAQSGGGSGLSGRSGLSELRALHAASVPSNLRSKFTARRRW